MTQENWEDGVGGWVLKLQPDSQAANQLELSVVFEQGRMGLPNGMAWNLVRPSSHALWLPLPTAAPGSCSGSKT